SGPAWLARSGPRMMFFFSSRRRHTSSKRDWSSDVCSSDLLRLLHSPVEQRHDAQAVRRADGLVAALEQVEHEALDALRPTRLGNGGVPSRREAHSIEDDQAHDDEQRGGRGRHGLPIAPDELANPVAEGVGPGLERLAREVVIEDRKSTRLNSSHVSISYAVFCLKKKKKNKTKKQIKIKNQLKTEKNKKLRDCKRNECGDIKYILKYELKEV